MVILVATLTRWIFLQYFNMFFPTNLSFIIQHYFVKGSCFSWWLFVALCLLGWKPRPCVRCIFSHFCIQVCSWGHGLHSKSQLIQSVHALLQCLVSGCKLRRKGICNNIQQRQLNKMRKCQARMNMNVFVFWMCWILIKVFHFEMLHIHFKNPSNFRTTSCSRNYTWLYIYMTSIIS